jgi:Ser/Thr protein kinase RdoA (MazF antagonist)
VIEGLDRLRIDPAPGVAELREGLQELVGARDALRLRSVRFLKERKVARLSFTGQGGVRRLVVKQLACAIAERNRRVARRWLPAVGLERIGPPLLATVAVRGGEWVWHVYEDLGDRTLRADERESVVAAATAIAGLHARCREHPLLAECRLHGGDLGMHFYRSNVRDAQRAVAALLPMPAAAARGRQALCARLLRRLERLAAETDARAAFSAAHAGPETLLHGDLWRENVFVIPETGGLRVRLIDWDHAAVGHVCYDLSTFLGRFPRDDREWILAAYRDATAALGMVLPPRRALAALFETAELARLVNRLIWPALAVADGTADWGFQTLAEVEGWFEDREPVLDRGAGRGGRRAS